MKHVLTLLLIVFCKLAPAQQVGSKVSFLGEDGKPKTGVIKSNWFKHFKVKYDGSQFESWLELKQLTVLENSNTSSTQVATVSNASFIKKVEAPPLKDSLSVPNNKTSILSIKDTKADDVRGHKISVVGADGKTYTGTITDSYGDSYKVKYDGFDDETWADKSVFALLNAPAKTAAIKPLQAALRKSNKVEFDLYGDGTKWVNGIVLLVNQAKVGSCLMYKVKYIYDASHIYTFNRDCKQVRSLSTTFSKITPSIKDSINKTTTLLGIDSSLVGEYRCYQPIWEYNTKTNGWEGRGIITLNTNGTFHLASHSTTGHYEWDSFKNIIKFHDGLEGAIATPTVKAKNNEIRILFDTTPAKTWSCSTHKN